MTRIQPQSEKVFRAIDTSKNGVLEGHEIRGNTRTAVALHAVKLDAFEGVIKAKGVGQVEVNNLAEQLDHIEERDARPGERAGEFFKGVGLALLQLLVLPLSLIGALLYGPTMGTYGLMIVFFPAVASYLSFKSAFDPSESAINAASEATRRFLDNPKLAT